MHLMLLLLMVSCAYLLRYSWSDLTTTDWHYRWQRALVFFLLPVLLLLTSAIAIVWMGPRGQMVWPNEGWVSYILAAAFLLVAIGSGIQLTYQGCQLINHVRTYPPINLHGHTVRMLTAKTPYIAQVGFWHPELVITPELLTILTSEHLKAVLAHERAHHHYHDTFIFFWLGWCRQITAWLPQTEVLWQELLVLREIRADRWASQQTDPLLVAEALLIMVQNSSCYHLVTNNADWGVAFSQFVPGQRLNQRIDALLAAPETMIEQPIFRVWRYLVLAFLPLLMIPFHH